MATATVDLEKQLSELGLGEGWKWMNGSWWLEPGDAADVRGFAQKMLAIESRLVAITATEQDDHEIRLDYQWDLNGNLLSYSVATKEKQVPSIVDLSPAADWAERETYEYFAVEFSGRATMEPLMLRVGQEIGVNLRKEEAK